MDLIREALLKVQQGDPNGSIAGYTDDEMKYHRALAIEVGLLKGWIAKDNTMSTPIPAAVVISDLTWEGHDFIYAMREQWVS